MQNYGTVDGSDTGGIVGNNNTGGTISACNNTGIAMATGSVGGIAGYNYAWIYDCYNTGLVTGGFGLNKASWVAGIVPENHSRSNEEGISNCYNVGSISQADILKSAISRGEFKIVLQIFSPELTMEMQQCYLTRNLLTVHL